MLVTRKASVYLNATPNKPRLDLGVRCVPDTLGYRKRIGIIVPSTNTTVGPECELFRVPGVTCHTGRVTIKERPLNTEEAFFEHMTMMPEGMRTAIDQIMTGRLHQLIVVIAPGSFLGAVVAADQLPS